MSSENSNRLFYVTRRSEKSFSLYSVRTDHLILSEVSEEVISDFLFLNEPTHPALSDEYVSSRCNGSLSYSAPISNYSYDSYYSYSLSDEELDEIANSLTLNYPRFIPSTVCEDLDLDDCISEKTFFGGLSGNDDSNKQLSFNFVNEVDERIDKILTDFLDNPDNLLKAHKAQDILTNSMNDKANAPPDLYVVRGYSDDPKSQWDSNREGWKDLNIEDD